MTNKHFSLHDAYVFGVRTVTNHFGFFFVAMLLAAAASLAVLGFLGMVEYTMFKEHFEAMVNVGSQAMGDAFGLIRYGSYTISEQVREYLPAAFAAKLAPAEVISIDISREDIVSAMQMIVPAALVFKLFVETMAVGWTKLALDVQANKSVEYDYLYKFYYLVPRVLVVEIVKYVATVVGLLLFVFPGVFIYQRLRFAKYFIIDKNQSIVQALESSWKLTGGSVVHLCGYSIFASFLMSLGRILFPALFFLVPLGFQVDANVYRQMSK